MLADTAFLLNANRYVEIIAIGLRDVPIRQGSYTLGKNGSLASAIYDNSIGFPSDIFRTDSIHTGRLTITMLDKQNRIISGTFSFIAYNALQQKTVTISEGKFRLKYGIY